MLEKNDRKCYVVAMMATSCPEGDNVVSKLLLSPWKRASTPQAVPCPVPKQQRSSASRRAGMAVLATANDGF